MRSLLLLKLCLYLQHQFAAAQSKHGLASIVQRPSRDDAINGASSCGFSTNWNALQMHENSFGSKVMTQHNVANAQDLTCNAMTWQFE